MRKLITRVMLCITLVPQQSLQAALRLAAINSFSEAIPWLDRMTPTDDVIVLDVDETLRLSLLHILNDAERYLAVGWKTTLREKISTHDATLSSAAITTLTEQINIGLATPYVTEQAALDFVTLAHARDIPIYVISAATTDATADYRAMLAQLGYPLVAKNIHCCGHFISKANFISELFTTNKQFPVKRLWFFDDQCDFHRRSFETHADFYTDRGTEELHMISYNFINNKVTLFNRHGPKRWMAALAEAAIKITNHHGAWPGSNLLLDELCTLLG